MEFDDLQITLSSRQLPTGEAEVEVVLHFRTAGGGRSRLAIQTAVEHDAALSVETARENAWRSSKALLREALSLTQTPAAALIASKANREKLSRGETTDDNIF